MIYYKHRTAAEVVEALTEALEETKARRTAWASVEIAKKKNGEEFEQIGRAVKNASITADYIDGNKKTLYSYGVKVATIEGDKLTFLTENENHYTATTLRHIKEFLTQNGIHAGQKSDLLKIARAQKWQ